MVVPPHHQLRNMANVHLGAPAGNYDALVRALRQNGMQCLAPKFRQQVEDAITECLATGLPVEVFETCRCDQLARLYFDAGVSNAPNGDHTWHTYGLAVDIIHPSEQWNLYPTVNTTPISKWTPWHRGIYGVFKKHGMDSGSDWNSFKDWPHWQFGTLKPSPSPLGIETLHTKGKEAVWALVGAA